MSGTFCKHHVSIHKGNQESNRYDLYWDGRRSGFYASTVALETALRGILAYQGLEDNLDIGNALTNAYVAITMVFSWMRV
jgi:hypothetical protein